MAGRGGAAEARPAEEGVLDRRGHGGPSRRLDERAPSMCLGDDERAERQRGRGRPRLPRGRRGG
eukprot:6515690-Alexandrium_andersonii.AAC.1